MTLRYQYDLCYYDTRDYFVNTILLKDNGVSILRRQNKVLVRGNGS